MPETRSGSGSRWFWVLRRSCPGEGPELQACPMSPSRRRHVQRFMILHEEESSVTQRSSAGDVTHALSFGSGSSGDLELSGGRYSAVSGPLWGCEASVPSGTFHVGRHVSKSKPWRPHVAHEDLAGPESRADLERRPGTGAVVPSAGLLCDVGRAPHPLWASLLISKVEPHPEQCHHVTAASLPQFLRDHRVTTKALAWCDLRSVQGG